MSMSAPGEIFITHNIIRNNKGLNTFPSLPAAKKVVFKFKKTALVINNKLALNFPCVGTLKVTEITEDRQR